MDTVELRRKLTDRHTQLTERLSKIEGHLRSPGPKDSQERAAELENDEVLERLDETERIEVQEIRDALSRIDAGAYGNCASCGKAIAEKRLEALPTTRTCIACAS
jgi:DnaK suppressor protein